MLVRFIVGTAFLFLLSTSGLVAQLAGDTPPLPVPEAERSQVIRRGQTDLVEWLARDASGDRELTYAVGTAPTVSPFFPSSGSGTSVDLRVYFKDADGFKNGSRFYLLVNSTLSGTNSCLIEIDPYALTIRVANDDATEWLPDTVSISRADGPATFYGPVQNSNCAVPAVRMFIGGTNTLIWGMAGPGFYGSEAFLQFPIYFQPRFGGNKTVFAMAVDETGLNSGYSAQTALNIPSAQIPPIATTLTTAVVPPVAGNYTCWQVAGLPCGDHVKGTVTSFSQAGGIFFEQHVFIATPFQSGTAGGCIIVYRHRTHSWLLVDDAGTAFIGPATSPISNSVCTVNSAKLTALSDNSATAVFDVTFQPQFTGPLFLQAYSQDFNGVRTARYDTPGIHVNHPFVDSIPVASLTASATSGSEATYQLSVQNADGVGSHVIDFLVRDPNSERTGCLLLFEPVENGYQARMANYILQNWLTPFYLLGSAATTTGTPVADSGACRLFAEGSGYNVTNAGKTMTLTFKVGYSAGFAGPKLIHVMIERQPPYSYQLLGTFNVSP